MQIIRNTAKPELFAHQFQLLGTGNPATPIAPSTKQRGRRRTELADAAAAWLSWSRAASLLNVNRPAGKPKAAPWLYTVYHSYWHTARRGLPTVVSMDYP